MMPACLTFSLPWCAKGIKSGFLFLFLLYSLNGFSQAFQIPANRNPQFNAFLNPSNDPDINPNFSTLLHPRFHAKLNPAFNTDINPVFNPSINPYFQAEINPLYNKELDPKYNPDLNPFFYLTAVVYTLQAKPAALLVEAWPGRVITEFDTDGNWTGYWVFNEAGGFNFFDTAGDFKGVVMWPNGKGGFNIFDENPEWIGFVW